ncbi:MAG: hypothetical protein FJ104_13370 [Deltaproteobacteria bacterium]|nr:hypothetical protein [Deltaproteobacteria bacterium]
MIGKNFQLDPRVGGGFRGWVLQQYPSVAVAARGYATWSVEAKARIFRWLNLHRGYFESTGLTAPRHRGATLAADVGEQIPRAAWVLGTIGVPVSRVVEPIIRYEARAFRTVASPSRPVRIVPHGTSPDVDLSTIAATDRPLSLVSGFETLVAGVCIDPSRKAGATIDSRGGRMPVFSAGLGLTAYSKPYQVSVGDAVLDDVLFDARFRGAGLALGVELPPRPDQIQFDVAGQVGLGEVRLLRDLTLNSLLPETRPSEGLRPPEWLIGYVQGDVTVGYVHTLLATEPSVLLSGALTGGGATFFYFKTQVEEGEPVDAPPLNWDFLWGVRAALTVPL